MYPGPDLLATNLRELTVVDRILKPHYILESAPKLSSLILDWQEDYRYRPGSGGGGINIYFYVDVFIQSENKYSKRDREWFININLSYLQIMKFILENH